MTLDEAREAFYGTERSEQLPLAVNDVVTVKEGRRSGARAWVISLETLAPEPKYLVEYDDGSDEILALSHIRRQ